MKPPCGRRAAVVHPRRPFSSEPVHNRLPQRVREEVVEEQMELRDCTDIGAGGLIERDQSLDADLVPIARIKNSRCARPGRPQRAGRGARKCPRNLDAGGERTEKRGSSKSFPWDCRYWRLYTTAIPPNHWFEL